MGCSTGGVGLAQTHIHSSNIFLGVGLVKGVWQHWPTIAVPGKQVAKNFIMRSYHLEDPFFDCLVASN